MRKLIVSCLMMMFALAAMPGCKSVVSDHLIGEPLDAEQAQAFEGIWRTDDSVLHVKHIEGGTLIMAGVEWGDDKFGLGTYTIVVTSHQDARYVQMTAEEDEDENETDDTDDAVAEAGEKPWLLIGMLVSSNDDTLVLYPPNFDRFKQALAEGQLVGELKDDDRTVHIQGDKAALDSFIQPDNLHELFKYHEPGVMQRIGGLE